MRLLCKRQPDAREDAPLAAEFQALTQSPFPRSDERLHQNRARAILGFLMVLVAALLNLDLGRIWGLNKGLSGDLEGRDGGRGGRKEKEKGETMILLRAISLF